MVKMQAAVLFTCNSLLELRIYTICRPNTNTRSRKKTADNDGLHCSLLGVVTLLAAICAVAVHMSTRHHLQATLLRTQPTKPLYRL